MTDTVRQLIIQGITTSGTRFRPSDWAERLAGVMSPFRPPGSVASPLTYSPYVVPNVLDGVKCVVVDERLRQFEPLAWKFVVEFARDNQLVTSEACLLPDAAPATRPEAEAGTESSAATGADTATVSTSKS